MEQGWTKEMIGRHYGVTPMAVWRKLDRWGKTEKKPMYKDYLPWTVEHRHKDAAVFRRLRHLYLIEDGHEVSDDDKRRAMDLKKVLESDGTVIGYHPLMKPTRTSEVGGFFTARRREGDGKYHRN